MPGDRNRILELALESLENRKKQLELEIAEITSELKGGRARRTTAPAKNAKARPGPKAGVAAAKKRARFSEEEKLRRSERMKEYWRKKKTGKG